MTFQIGDSVQIKSLTENKRQNLPLFYSPSMTAYEGKIGIIIDVCNDALGISYTSSNSPIKTLGAG